MLKYIFFKYEKMFVLELISYKYSHLINLHLFIFGLAIWNIVFGA